MYNGIYVLGLQKRGETPSLIPSKSHSVLDFIYLLFCSSTLVLFVLNTKVTLCIAFQGAMSFSPTEKIASSRKKTVRAMVAHGACSLCIKLCWVTKT